MRLNIYRKSNCDLLYNLSQTLREKKVYKKNCYGNETGICESQQSTTICNGFAILRKLHMQRKTLTIPLCSHRFEAHESRYLRYFNHPMWSLCNCNYSTEVLER